MSLQVFLLFLLPAFNVQNAEFAFFTKLNDQYFLPTD